MTVKYSLPASIIRRIEGFKEAKDELSAFLADQRCARDEKSERWRESEKCEAHQTWTLGLEELEAELADLVDAIEAMDIPEFNDV